MNRRAFLATVAGLTASGVAGCSGDDPGEGPTATPAGTATDDRPEPTATSTDEPASPTPAPTDTPTVGPETPVTATPTVSEQGFDAEVTARLTAFYEAYSSADVDGMFDSLHATNDFPPPDELRAGAPDFDGELTDLDVEFLDRNLDESNVGALMERTRRLSPDDAPEFAGVANAHVVASPTVEGEASTEAAESLKKLVNSTREHFLAVENGEWRVVV